MPATNMWWPQVRKPTKAIPSEETTRPGIRVVVLVAEGRDHLGHDPHGGQDHDVDRRVGVEPEEVLVEDGVAARAGVEEPEPPPVVDADQEQRDAQHRRGQYLDDGRGVDRPDEDRELVPAQPPAPQRVGGDDEVDAGHDRADAQHEDPQHHGHHRRGRPRRVGRIERPARVGRAGHDRVQHDDGPGHVDPEAHEVEAREGHVLRADHERQEEVAERAGDGRDHEEPHHHHAVQREELVVRARAHERGARREVLAPDEERERAAQRQEEAHRDQVHDPDLLVVLAGEPRAQRGPRPVRHGPDLAAGGHRAGPLVEGRFGHPPSSSSSSCASDRMYSTMAAVSAGLTCPWNDGMMGGKPRTIFAMGSIIDSVM